MPNVIEELDKVLLKVSKSPQDITWLKLQYHQGYEDGVTLEPTKGIEGYNQAVSLLSSVEYYSGYGGQKLYGLVVFNDNSWLSREEYDGSECWDYNTTLQFPEK